MKKQSPTSIRDTIAWSRSSKTRWAIHVIRSADTCLARVVTDWIPRNVKEK